jgi:hypothetical protein
VIDAERERLRTIIDWTAIHHWLTEYVTSRMRGADAADIKDIVQQVLDKAWKDGCAGWDRDVEPNPSRYFQSRTNGDIVNWRRGKRRHGEEVPPDDLHSIDHTAETLAYLRQLVELFTEHIRLEFGEEGVRYILVATDRRADQAKELGLTDMEVTRLKRRILEFCEQLRKERGIPSGEAMYRRVPPPSPELRAKRGSLLEVLPEKVQRVASALEKGRTRFAVGVLVVLSVIALLFLGGVLYLGYLVVVALTL